MTTNRKAERPVVSILTPAFNEEGNLPALYARLRSVLDGLGLGWEWVVVDDHSTDSTWEVLRTLAAEDGRVKAIRFSRNFGSHSAMAAALVHSSGECGVVMAADLQDPPETLPVMLERWRAGYNVVWAVRQMREGVSLSTKLFAAAYYRMMQKFGLPEMPQQGADFFLIDRKVMDAYNAIAEKNSTLLGTVLWMGFRQTSVEYVKRARQSGSTKWTLAKKLKLVVDSIVSFSYAPIRAMSYLGIAMATVGFAYAAFVIIGRALGWVVAGTGFAALITAILIGQGMILTTLGVLGEYLWRTFDEARGRPRFIIEEAVGAPRAAERPVLVGLSASGAPGPNTRAAL